MPQTGSYQWDEMAFIDARCGALAEAAAGQGGPPASKPDAQLKRMTEQVEAIAGRIGQTLGASAPEYQTAKELWRQLRDRLASDS